MSSVVKFFATCCFAFWHSLCVADFGYAQRYFQNVGDSKSIPGGVVTAIELAPDGMLWLGTQSGVLRYDGYRFKRYRFDPANENSIAGDFISALKVARDGRIWIGTLGDGVSILDPATDRVRHLRHATVPEGKSNLSANNVRAFAEPKVGMWIGTDAGLDYSLDGQIQSLYAPPDQANAASVNFIRSLLIDRDGALWVGSNDGLRRLITPHSRAANGAAKRFSDLTLVPIASEVARANSLAGQGVNAILQLRDGSFLLATRLHGLAHLRIENSIGKNQIRRIMATDKVSLISSRIQSMLQVNSNEIWLATTAGLDVLDAQTLTLKHHWLHNPAVVGSLGFDAIGALKLDAAGTVWVGTWGGGLAKTLASAATFRTLRVDAAAVGTNATPSLSYADVHAVLELPDRRLLVGTGGNGIDVLDRVRGRIDGFRVNLADPNALGDGVVIALKQAPDQSVWVGTQTAGLFQLNLATRQFKHVGERGAVSNLLVARDGVVWLGGSNGVARVRVNPTTLEPEVEVVFDTDGKPVLGQLNPLAQDFAGRIWAGGNDGLRVLNPGAQRFQIIRNDAKRKDSLVHNTVYGLMVDRDGALWVATLKGVDRMTPLPAPKTPNEPLLPSALLAQASFAHVSATLGMPGRDIGGNLAQDALGRIWTDQMVLDLAKQSSYELTPADGVDIGTAWAGAHTQTHDGLLLNGGSTGLVVMDPMQFQPWAYTPTLIATELRINGLAAPLAQLHPRISRANASQARTHYEGLTLRPDQRLFSVEFSALDFSAPLSNRYAYRLAGFDSQWIATDAEQRTASYSNLWPRTYHLEVRGSNRVGAWSPNILSIPITVLPAFWQTAWFAVLMFGLLVAAIALGLRRRTRHLQLRSEQLDALVHARTAELETANTRLLATQAQLVQQEKLASLGQLVAGVAHEVNTPLGIALTASSFLQQRTGEITHSMHSASMSKSELERFIGDATQSSALVSQHLERAANLVRQFKQVSVDRAFDERREVRLDLLMGELIDSLQSLWKRRAITLNYSGAPEIMLNTYTGTIGQVLSNLLQNALLHAFGPEQSGTISIKVQVLRADQVEMTLSDDGIGMDDATRSQVFEPFFTTKRNQGGIGLGLHVVFNLVTSRLGGTIEVHSTLGSGSRFVVRFPARLAA